jgi:hypothetical protein
VRRSAVAAAAALLFAVGLTFVHGDSRGSRPRVRGGGAQSSGWDVYDRDPAHVWNRLYRALYARAARDGTEYGRDETDPLLWASTGHLLGGDSNAEAARVLDEFLEARAERLVADPLKRAMLQRDLWAVFDWTVYRTERPAPGLRALQSRLAKVIRRLAPAPEQAAALPDNYEAAAASGAFASDYDPARPDAPFLPPDLFKPGGPWVEVGVRGGGTVAPAHVAGAGGRSVFRVFVRLPQGRAATLEYLGRVAAFGKLWVRDPRKRSDPRPNPQLPQFPAGTRLALVRQMLLADAGGEPLPTAVTESVQLRVHRAVPARIPEAFDIDEDEARGAMSVCEFRLSRARLFAGEAGGLRAVARDERELPVFQSHGFDPFEAEAGGRDSLERSFRPVLASCSQCHFRPGIHSVLSREPGTVELRLRDVRRDLVPAGGAAAAFDTAREWKRRQASWRLLRELWD